MLKIVFVNNLRNKATALVLAIVTWLVVSFEVSAEYERNDVTVEIIPQKNGVLMDNVAVEPANIVVKAVFTAPQRIAQQYLAPAARVRAVCKFENPPIGDPITIKLNREDFDLPYDVKLSHVEPKTIQVVVRQIVTRRLRVQVLVRGKPAAGYELAGEPQVDPTEVFVRGQKEVLDVASSIATEPVDIEGRSIPFSSDYSLATGIAGRPVEASTKVRVRFNIRPVEIIKTFKVPLHVSMPPGYEHEVLFPKLGTGVMVELPVRGPEFLLNKPDAPGKLSAFVVVDSRKMHPRRGIPYSTEVHLLVPPELSGLSLPGEHYVDVEIRERE